MQTDQRNAGDDSLAAAEKVTPRLYLKLISMSPAGRSDLFKGQDPVTAILISLGCDSTGILEFNKSLLNSAKLD